MSNNAKIPLIISVTGHRQLREADRKAIESSVRNVLNDLKKKYPSTPLKLMTNLAEGADTLCARIALEMGIPLIAALPRPIETYRTCFEGAALEEFNALVEKAESVFTVPDTEERPADAPRQFDYRQGGLYLVTHSQVLMALWEGNEPKPHGCGAAEITQYALQEKQPVIHIAMPRTDSCRLPAGEISEYGNTEELKKLDEFNSKVEKMDDREDPGIYPQAYYAAAALSRKAANTYRKILKVMAVLGTALALALLLFDELEMGRMIFVCGVVLIAIIFVRRYAVKSRCQDEYLEYRVLAESLRVQACLQYAGSRLSMNRLFTLYQKTVTEWITRSVPVLEIGRPEPEAHDITKLWLEDQLNYHEKTKTTNRRKNTENNRLLNIVRGLSILTYLSAAVMEYLLPVVWLRSAVCITLGFFAAASLFLSLYFGRLSLSRHCDDSAMMADFYRNALEKLKSDGQTDALLEECAREEILENANWFAYSSENAPDMSFL